MSTDLGECHFDNINYRLSALTSLQNRLSKNTLILAFQDRESVYGNYMFATSSGYGMKPIIINLIEGLRIKYSLDKLDLIFYGNSKGGTIGLDFIDDYPGSCFLYGYSANKSL
jgi:hypothetical protein